MLIAVHHARRSALTEAHTPEILDHEIREGEKDLAGFRIDDIVTRLLLHARGSRDCALVLKDLSPKILDGLLVPLCRLAELFVAGLQIAFQALVLLDLLLKGLVIVHELVVASVKLVELGCSLVPDFVRFFEPLLQTGLFVQELLVAGMKTAIVTGEPIIPILRAVLFSPYLVFSRLSCSTSRVNVPEDE